MEAVLIVDSAVLMLNVVPGERKVSLCRFVVSVQTVFRTDVVHFQPYHQTRVQILDDDDS